MHCFFSSLPDSPAEPDGDEEDSGHTEPKLIPHDEVFNQCFHMMHFIFMIAFSREQYDRMIYVCAFHVRDAYSTLGSHHSSNLIPNELSYVAHTSEF